MKHGNFVENQSKGMENVKEFSPKNTKQKLFLTGRSYIGIKDTRRVHLLFYNPFLIF